MIYVCDAIMGSGKSSAAIQYMNEHKNDKFIYVTPYLDEAERIKKQCRDLHFVEPSNAFEEFGHTKSGHTAALIKDGCNITTTHQSFKNYTQEMLDGIKEKKYTIFIDENLEILNPCDDYLGDIQLLIEAGYIEEQDGGEFTLTDKEYTGFKFKDIIWMLRSRSLMRTGINNGMFYWSIPKELIDSFKDVYVLTYLFEGQSMYYFFRMNNITYQNIYISKNQDGVFRFSTERTELPGYVSKLKDLIHILDIQRMNEVDFNCKEQRENEKELSMNWFSNYQKKENVEQLQKNLTRLFNVVWSDSTSENRMWGTFSKSQHKLRGRGYSKNFLIFNSRATNKYRKCKYLAYLANIYMNVNEKLFYQSCGLDVYEDRYALSVLIQWIWRSAIRDGGEIWLYLPCIRMRRLLLSWIDDLSKSDKANLCI